MIQHLRSESSRGEDERHSGVTQESQHRRTKQPSVQEKTRIRGAGEAESGRKTDIIFRRCIVDEKKGG